MGCPSYDERSRKLLEQAWPGHSWQDGKVLRSGFPNGFFDPVDTDGEDVQVKFMSLVFTEWEKYKLRIPFLDWFTAFEMHIEGDDCSETCNPCRSDGTDDPNCHLCAPGEKIDFLSTNPSEREKRFFGSCGLIRSNGVPKRAWDGIRFATWLLRSQHAVV